MAAGHRQRILPRFKKQDCFTLGRPCVEIARATQSTAIHGALWFRLQRLPSEHEWFLMKSLRGPVVGRVNTGHAATCGGRLRGFETRF